MHLSKKIIAGLIALALFLGLFSVYRRDRLNTLVDVYIADQHFRIPYKYFDSPASLQPKHNSVLLEVRWPDMASRSELGGRKAYEEAQLVDHTIGGILVQADTDFVPFEAYIKALRDNETAQYEKMEPQFGLAHYSLTRGGLGGPRTLRKDDFFFEYDESGRISTLLQCGAEIEGRFPVCNQRFLYGTLRIELSYNKKNFLSEWRTQRDRAVAFLEQFRVNSTTEGE